MYLTYRYATLPLKTSHQRMDVIGDGQRACRPDKLLKVRELNESGYPSVPRTNRLAESAEFCGLATETWVTISWQKRENHAQCFQMCNKLKNKKFDIRIEKKRDLEESHETCYHRVDASLYDRISLLAKKPQVLGLPPAPLLHVSASSKPSTTPQCAFERCREYYTGDSVIGT
ncbi:uncharacterized protein EAF01_002906 [Botrytis porri]|uniref:uncharacterized protein n=1 Tax=Botrytis porri TaxID=87229 RepID=UPI001901F145|nr:uncharacterized protein EAF01_002906 [Botrytis porri]KAF7911399.1 hypothetical protein EAF01_002906 [Botrytis porri]